MKAPPVAAALLALAGIAVADLRFTEKSKDEIFEFLSGKQSKAPRKTVVALKGRVVKFSEFDGADQNAKREVIFDAAAPVQKDMNPRSRTWFEENAEELKAKAEKAKAKTAEWEKKLPLMSGDKKKSVEKHVWTVKKNLGLLEKAPKVELKRTGEKQKIGEYECERIVIEEADETGAMQAVFDCWMTEALEGWSVYADMYAAYHAFSPAVLEKMKEVKGFHVKGKFTVFWITGQQQKTEFDNSDVKVVDVPEAEFQVPADFTKK
jgi:hypothetical protein